MGWSSAATGDFRKLATLGRRQWCLLLLSVVLLPAATLSLKLWGYRRVERELQRLLRPRTCAGDAAEIATSTARVVAAVARRSPIRANCLAHSVVLWALLRLQGVETQLRFGFRRDGGEFRAHAWVERLGLPLNDSQDVREVHEVLDFPRG